MELLPFRSLRDTLHDDGPLPPARVAGSASASWPGCERPTRWASFTAT